MKSKHILMPLIAAAGCAFTLLSAEDAPKPPGEGRSRPDGPPPGAPADPKARLGEFIKKMDTNGDGKISKEEFIAFEKQQAEDRFSKIDANNDGTIDENEVAEAGRKMAEARGGDRGAPRGEPNGGFRRPDGAAEKEGSARRPEAGGDGAARRPEGGDNARRGDGAPGAARPDGAPRAGGFAGGGMGAGMGEIFRRVQENGSISKEEFHKITDEQFAKLDANSDGKVTKDELEESMRKMREAFGNRGGQGSPRPEGGGVRPRPEGDAPKPRE